MGFAPETRVFAGIPEARFHDSCTYTATDSSQPAMSVSLAVEVLVDPPGMLAFVPSSDPISPLRLEIGEYHSEPLPSAGGGVKPYTYSFTCAGGELPDGMAFAPETRVFAGTPNARFRDSCTYTVTDSAQPAETVSTAIEVEVTGGAPPLELTQLFERVPGNELTLKIGRRSQTEFQSASGGVEPYTYELLDCSLPAGLEFSPGTLILSGTPNAEYRGPNCTYQVTDSSSPPMSASLSFVLVVEPLEASGWRFRTRTVEPGGPCVLPGSGPRGVATLPAAHAGAGEAGYALPGAPHPPESGTFLSFNPSSRVLTYANPDPPPVRGTPNTYRYLVGTEADVTQRNADDALCLDVEYEPRDSSCRREGPLTHILITLRVRDDAFWDESAQEYRCPDTTAPEPRSGAQGVSNPVHTALAPVHARRATDVAHTAIRDRVRNWSPEAPRPFAVAPSVDFASLSGQSDGFDYTGSSQALSAGAELGAGSWQAGLVAAFTQTELRYRAAAMLTELGYQTGEHDTEMFSVHPFAAWHAPTRGHLWASLGAGLGDLRHRDDLGFPSWSSSDVQLRTYAAGASVPLADVLSGELDAEAGIESFAFDIEGGGQISDSLPTLRGRDYRAGLAWSAPVRGAPSVSLAYRELSGDGPEGGQVVLGGAVSAVGILDPRLTLTGSVEAAFGLGDQDQDFWRLGGGVRFAPDDLGRGLNLDTRLFSPAEGYSAGIGVRGEAGYGLWSGPVLGVVRPYVGLIRYPGDGAVRRSVGLNLGDASASQFKVELYDYDRDRSPALKLAIRRRF